MVIRLEGETTHFSVVAGIDKTKLRFFDSGGLRSILREDCAVRRGAYLLSATRMFRVKMVQLNPPDVPNRHIQVFDYKVILHG